MFDEGGDLVDAQKNMTAYARIDPVRLSRYHPGYRNGQMDQKKIIFSLSWLETKKEKKKRKNIAIFFYNFQLQNKSKHHHTQF